VAITRINYQDTLRMRFDLGPDPEDPTLRNQRARSYTRGRHNASDANFFNLAQGFALLFDAELVNAYRVMHVELVDDGGS
jgi:hypothetical protein